MRSRRPLLTSALTAAAAAGAVLGTALSSPAGAIVADTPAQARDGFTFAVVGDVPYGEAQVAKFPSWVDQISADEQVRWVAHVGDIKSGSSRCDDSYFQGIRAQFDRFDTPLVYTPGDNEWTDCHRLSNGGYDPLERLDAIRATFFPEPGRTLGAKQMNVDSQAALGFPENVDWRDGDVTFTAAHVVGSNNGTAPWTGLSAQTAQQAAEVEARNAANIAQVREAFAEATARHDRAVVVFQQADMFDPTWDVTYEAVSAFTEYIQVLIDESNAFAGEVYLVDGDSHVYNVDTPLAAGSPWLSLYGVAGSADNLTRITVDGSSNNTDWLRVTVRRVGEGPVLSWEQVPYTG